MEGPRETQIHTDQDHYLDRGRPEDIELVQDLSLLDRGPHPEGEEVGVTARDEMEGEGGEAQVTAVTAVMMTGVEVEAEVVEAGAEDEHVKN